MRPLCSVGVQTNGKIMSHYNNKIIQVRKDESIEYKNVDMIVTAKAVAKKAKHMMR